MGLYICVIDVYLLCLDHCETCNITKYLCNRAQNKKWNENVLQSILCTYQGQNYFTAGQFGAITLWSAMTPD
jgi:hypothetical protein